VDVHFWHFRRLSLALGFYKFSKLLDDLVLYTNVLLGFFVDAVVGIEFFLELNYSFVPLVKSPGECDHDISLFEQQRLVLVDLLLIHFDFFPFFLDFLHFLSVLHPDLSLLLFNSRSEVGMVLYFLAAH